MADDNLGQYLAAQQSMKAHNLSSGSATSPTSANFGASIGAGLNDKNVQGTLSSNLGSDLGNNLFGKVLSSAALGGNPFDKFEQAISIHALPSPQGHELSNGTNFMGNVSVPTSKSFVGAPDGVGFPIGPKDGQQH